MRRYCFLFSILCFWLAIGIVVAEEFSCRFAKGQWNPGDFQAARSPRWEVSATWEQHGEYICNRVPDELKGKPFGQIAGRAGELYASMLYRRPVSGGAVFATTCLFEEEMAPALVLSPDLAKVYGEHIEIVLYNKGVNIWHHWIADGKPNWRLIAFFAFPAEADKAYRLQGIFSTSARGNYLAVWCGENELGRCLLPDAWPARFYVGITACEGTNRFYDFSVKTK